MPEKIGVQVFIDTGQLSKGVSEYQSALNKLVSATESVLPKLSFETAFSSLRKAASELTPLTQSIQNVSQAFSSASANAERFSRAVQSVGKSQSNVSFEKFSSDIQSTTNTINGLNPTKFIELANSTKVFSNLMRTTSKDVGEDTSKINSKFDQLIKNIQTLVGEVNKLDTTKFVQLANSAKTLSDSIKNLSADVGSFSNKIGKVDFSKVKDSSSEVKKAASDTKVATDNIGSYFNNMGLKIAAGVAIGNAAVQGFKALIYATVNATREVINAVGFWERLGFSVQFYAARAKQAQGDTRAYADILNSVQGESEATVVWLQRLAVLSPFTAQQVATIYRVAQAYGLTKEAASDLLPKLLDLGAAAGLDADVLQRIALAFGQVQARGKLTGEEIRQFGNAGIPIKDLLIKNLKIANSEFENLVESGYFTADIVLPLVTKSLEDFDGAAKLVSTQTISGLINALTEIRQIAEAKLFGSIFEQLQPQLQKLVEAFSGTEVPAVLQAIGEQIGSAFASILGSIQTFIQNIINGWNSLSTETRDAILIFAGATVVFIGLGLAIAGITAIVTALINPITVLATAFAGFIAWWTRGATVLDEFQIAYIESITIIGTSTEAVSETITGWAESTTDATETVTSGFKGVGDSAITFGSVIGKTFSSVISAISTTASQIYTFFADIADAFRWGLDTGRAWASGLISSMSSVISAINIVGSAISGLMAPASPPKFLSHIDEWGRETMQIYLDSFTEADFGVIKDVGDTMRQLLNADILGGATEADVLARVIGSRDAITRAVGEIVDFGNVTEQTFAEIRRYAGSAGDEIEAYLSIYARVSQATRQETSLQEKLNAVKERYDATLKSLNNQLSLVTENQKQANESQDIAKLQRVINRFGVGDTRTREAQAKIQQILIERQIRGVEQQQNAEESRIESQLTAAQKAREIAQAELDLLKERISYQTDGYQLQLNYNQALLALQSSFGGVDDVASQVNKELQDQLKAIQLQKDELSDLERLYAAQLVLNDKNATAAEKAAAQLVVQEVSLNQQMRDIEATNLGITLENIRNIQIVLSDVQGLGAGGALGPDFVSPTQGQSEAAGGLIGSLEELRAQLDKARTAVLKFTETLRIKFSELNEALPSWLKLWTEDGSSPALQLAITAGGFIVVASALGKLKSVIGAIVGIFSGAQWLLRLFGLGGAAAGVGAGAGAAATTTGGFVAALTAALPYVLAASIIAALAAVVYKLFTDEDWQETANTVSNNINTSIGDYLIENAPGFSAYLATNYISKLFGADSEVEKEVELTGESIGSAFALALLSKLTSLLPTALLSPLGLGTSAAIRDKVEEEVAKAWNADPGFDVEEPKIEFSVGTMFAADGRTAGQVFIDGFVAHLNENPVEPFTFSGLFNKAVQGLDKFIFGDETNLDEEAKTLGQTIVDNVAQGLNTTESQTIANNGGQNVVTNIVKPIYGPKTKQETKDAGIELSKYIVDGIQTGINQDETWANTAAEQLRDKILGEINASFGIESPSTVMRDEVGIPIAQGILVGIEEFAGSDKTKYSKTIIEDFKTGLNTVILNTKDQLSTLSTDLLLIMGTLSTNLLVSINSFASSAQLAFGTAFGTIVLSASTFSVLMQSIFTGLNTSLTDKQNVMLLGLNDSFDSFVIAMTGSEEARVPLFASTFVSIFEDMRSATNDTMSKLKDNVLDSFSNGTDGLIDILGEKYGKEDTSNPAYAFGVDFITAIRKGMESQSDALSGTLGQTLGKALDDNNPTDPNAPNPNNPLPAPPAPKRAQISFNTIGAEFVKSSEAVYSSMFNSMPSQIGSSGIVTNNYIKNYYLTVNSGQSSESVVKDFGFMELAAL